MSTQEIATAMQRVEAALQRRPEFGPHDDAPAMARWQGGLRVLSSHANGTSMLSDMPAEIGGSGDLVTPGWLFRAGVASCAATRIAMGAAAEGITLTQLEVQIRSRSDTRGMLGMSDASGDKVAARPTEMQMVVQIAASDVPAARLRQLVEDCQRCAPISDAVRHAVPIDLHVEVISG